VPPPPLPLPLQPVPQARHEAAQKAQKVGEIACAVEAAAAHRCSDKSANSCLAGPPASLVKAMKQRRAACDSLVGERTDEHAAQYACEAALSSPRASGAAAAAAAPFGVRRPSHGGARDAAAATAAAAAIPSDSTPLRRWSPSPRGRSEAAAASAQGGRGGWEIDLPQRRPQPAPRHSIGLNFVR